MNAMGANPLARKKKSEPVRDPDTWKGQPLAIQVRGTPEWKEWVEGLASANRQNVAGLVDTALARLAKEIGFRDPPDR
jgi:hypothetical protein